MSYFAFNAARRVLGLSASLFLAGGLSAAAHDFSVGDLTIDHPTARINIGDRPSAGYFVIKNDGDEADRLIAASSPAFGRIELHDHVMSEGVMRMVSVEAIEAPANGEAALERGGLHLMLFDPTDALGDGALIPVTLEFEKAGAVEITMIGEKIGRSGGHGDHGGHGHHGDHKADGHEHKTTN